MTLKTEVMVQPSSALHWNNVRMVRASTVKKVLFGIPDRARTQQLKDQQEHENKEKLEQYGDLEITGFFDRPNYKKESMDDIRMPISPDRFFQDISETANNRVEFRRPAVPSKRPCEEQIVEQSAPEPSNPDRISAPAEEPIKEAISDVEARPEPEKQISGPSIVTDSCKPKSKPKQVQEPLNKRKRPSHVTGEFHLLFI